MRKTILFAAAMAAVSLPAMVQAADEKAGAKKEIPGNTAEDVQRGVEIIRLFNGALASDKLSKEQKGALIACLYNNPVRTISLATGKVFAENAKLDASKPGEVFGVAAAVCQMPKEAAPAASKSDSTQGR